MNARGSSDRFSPDNLLYDGASKVVSAEFKHLKEWRGREPCVGLALSGGGIRSATYALGVLQALAYRRAMPQVDYLSTVSGGGYIGVSLSYLLHQSAHGTQGTGLSGAAKFDVSRENFPYVSYPMVGVGDKVSEQGSEADKGVPEARLREHEKFKGRLVRRLRQSANYLLILALALLVVGGLPWVYALLEKRHLNHIQGWMQMLDLNAESGPAGAGMLATFTGIIGSVRGYLQSRSGDKHRIPTGLVVGFASALLAFGLLLLVYMLTGWMHANHFMGGYGGILGVSGCVLLFFGWLPEANYLSLHRYYRDRLMELFLPDLRAVGDSLADSATDVMKPKRPRATGLQPGDATLLGALCQTSGTSTSANKLLRGPYPLINANLVLTASEHPRYRARGGDNFLFSPLYCGSRATDWQPTDCTPGNGYTLATAMAISGAAVNPNSGPGGEGITRQPVLSVLMGMLNLRLGFWATNLNHASAMRESALSNTWFKPNQLFPGLAESFGRFFLNEHARFSLLTDGGHFENLGLCELVRRRLKLIIVCDASADPKFNFSDLANAIQKVRADFGAIIDINDEQLATLMPRPTDWAGTTGMADSASAGASRGYLIAPIRYSTRVGQNPNTLREVGTLILLKATAFRGSPADVFSYRREHP